MGSKKSEEGNAQTEKLRTEHENTETQDILTWKTQMGKTTWSPQTPNRITIREEYNKWIQGNDLELFFVNKRLQSYTHTHTHSLSYNYRGNDLVNDYITIFN